MAQPSPKQQALHAVEQLPDDATLENAMERLYLLEKVARGRASVRENRTTSHAEVQQRYGST